MSTRNVYARKPALEDRRKIVVRCLRCAREFASDLSMDGRTAVYRRCRACREKARNPRSEA